MRPKLRRVGMVAGEIPAQASTCRRMKQTARRHAHEQMELFPLT